MHDKESADYLLTLIFFDLFCSRLCASCVWRQYKILRFLSKKPLTNVYTNVIIKTVKENNVTEVFIMTLAQALKCEFVIEVETDLYLTQNGRVLKYDRYYFKARSRRPSNMWTDDSGNVFHNFTDAYYCERAYKWA